MNLIYMCVFNKESYINLLHLLITSISVKSNINKKTTDILIITSPSFKLLIEKDLFDFDLPINYYLLELHTLFEAGCARLNIFNYDNINQYDNILYLDTDVLVNGDLNIIFDTDISSNKIYALEEGTIGHEFWGAQFFDFSKINIDTPAFTSGILYFKRSPSIMELFEDIKHHITDFIYINNNNIPCCLDQPFIVYNSIMQNKYDNTMMKKYVENNPSDVNRDKNIYHFPGCPGFYENKYDKMTSFWIKMNEIPRVLFQTNKKKNEEYVLDMINLKLGAHWEYKFYSDDDIIKFFEDNPVEELHDIIQKYNSIISGAHKADLFRYYYLYVNGGFFMDSDAMIYANIEYIVKDFNFVSVNSSCHPGTIFQGILGASPKNEIIKRALFHAYNTEPQQLQVFYHYLCKHLYDIIKENTFWYNIKLYNEQRINDEIGDDIFDENRVLLFKHYWKYKIIPQSVTTYYTYEFTQIYNNNYWGNGSGAGSYIENTQIYNNTLIEFIKKNNITKITDIGCGDWQSSNLIYEQLSNIDYLGIDCVKTVIEQNKIKYPQYQFMNLDIICNMDLLRDSELYIVKDVLQHWMLNDIYNFLDCLITKNFKYIIITNNGNQYEDDLELNAYIGNGRGLHSRFLPLKKYNSLHLLDYYGGENKHMCIIEKNYTDWNNYNKIQINDFDFRTLTTYSIPNKLIRCGPQEDGGYVIADGFEYDLFISCGIANDIRFEDDFLDIHHIKCYAFDGTIPSIPWHKNNIEWIPKNIGYTNTDKTTNLKEYIQGSNKIFLKMDIEGSEFNWLDAMTKQELEQFSQIVLEVHWPFDIYRMNMLQKLNETHFIIHNHGNNYCDRDIPKHLPSGRSYDGTVLIKNINLPEITLPEVFEVTYVNKNLFNDLVIEMKEINFPTILDYPNNGNVKDIEFSIPIM